MMWKKILPVSLLITSFSFAEETSSQNASTRSFDEQNSEVFTPSQIKESKRLFATAELLFLKAQMDDLGFAVKSKSQTTVKKGKGKDPKLNWNWGFKVGFGYNLPHDFWDLSGSYTQYRSSTYTKESSQGSEALFPSWQYNDIDYVTKALAKWSLHFQLGDLELGRAIELTHWLSIRPLLGIRGAWIFQKYNIDYSGGPSIADGDTDAISMKNNFFGIGARAGANTLWGLVKGLSLFGDGSLSLLSGFFDVQQKEKLKLTKSSILDISSHPQEIVTMVDLALGFQYDTFFQKKRCHLGAKLGYEFSYLFNQNQFIRFISGSYSRYIQNNGNLSLMGLSAGIRFDF